MIGITPTSSPLPAAPGLVTIRIRPKDGGAYKSISTLTWTDIPRLAVLTGSNGAGKTQLLELLGYHFSEAFPQAFSHLGGLPVQVEIEGDSYQPSEIGYLPSEGRFSGGAQTSVGQLANVRQQVIQYAQQWHSYRFDIAGATRSQKSRRRLEGTNAHSLSPEQIELLFPDDLEYAIDDIDVAAGLTHVFLAHRLKVSDARDNGHDGRDRHGKPLGVAPWETVNEALSTAGFHYRVVSPFKTRLQDNYSLELEDIGTGRTVQAIDLSSGEKVILQLLLWLFAASKDGMFPRLLILDEPDAHLHPAMTRQFLDVIANSLVGRHGVRVIMTTHSPSTVALAPEGSVFQMSRGATEIVPAKRSEVIPILTAGLVTVSPASKYCFVEDESDVNFYTAVHSILTDYGPTSDPRALKAGIPISFIRASLGSGQSKTPGGATVVRQSVEKLSGEPLSSLFAGIVDRDISSKASDRVFVIGRYSIENYLADPLMIFALLLEDGKAPAIPGVTLSPGSEHLLRSQDQPTLQRIVDTIANLIESSSSNYGSQPRKLVTYTNNQVISMPRWVIDGRGHDVMQMARLTFGSPSSISQARLLKVFQRVRLIPLELADVLSEIQAL